MTAEKFIENEEYFKGCASLMLLIKEDVIEFAKAYAKQMCDKQREICAESIRLDIVPDKYSLTGKVTIHCKDSITNAPYPEELNT